MNKVIAEMESRFKQTSLENSKDTKQYVSQEIKATTLKERRELEGTVSMQIKQCQWKEKINCLMALIYTFDNVVQCASNFAWRNSWDMNIMRGLIV